MQKVFKRKSRHPQSLPLGLSSLKAPRRHRPTGTTGPNWAEYEGCYDVRHVHRAPCCKDYPARAGKIMKLI